MGKKAKNSSEGKKALRANISTEPSEDYFEKSNKDALSCGSVAADVPSNCLFSVDKSKDLSVQRKIAKRRDKILHCDSMLQSNTFVQPIPSSTQKKRSEKNGKAVQTVKHKVAAQDSLKKRCPQLKNAGECFLPLDFVEQQRAYFKEVDEFELPEEEISQDELD